MRIAPTVALTLGLLSLAAQPAFAQRVIVRGPRWGIRGPRVVVRTDPTPVVVSPVRPIVVSPPRATVIVNPAPPRAVVVQPAAPRAVVVQPAQPIRVRTAPPAARVEMRSPSPGQGYVWVNGNWFWNGNQYVWIPGHWEYPPQNQATWVEASYQYQNGYYVWAPGYWNYGTANTNTNYAQSQTFAMSYQLNTQVNGTLYQGDNYQTTGSYYDDYLVDLQAGQTAIFVASGLSSYTAGNNTLDVMLSIYDNGNLVAQDDDGAGYPNARVDFTAPRSGQFVVRISTATANYAQGEYSLQSWLVNSPQVYSQPAQPVVVTQPSQPVVVTQPSQPVVVTQPVQEQAPPNAIVPGAALNGNLGPGDRNLQGGSYLDDYPIYLQAGQPLTIVSRGGPAVQGGVVDVYTELYGTNGQLLAQDDNSAGGVNSRIVLNPSVSGYYTIRVSSLRGGAQQGSYVLQTWSGSYPTAQ